MISPGVGVGPLKLEMQRAQVDRLLGGPEGVNVFDNGQEIYYHYYTKGISILFTPSRAKAIFLYSGIPGGFEDGRFGPFPGYTSKDINLKSTKKEILAKYGKPLLTLEQNDAPITATSVLEYAGISFECVQDTGRIIFIRIFKNQNGNIAPADQK